MQKNESTGPAPVLVVGAGPTGLLMSLWLTKYGVPHRIVDKTTGTGQTSRAIVMHARTLELYRMLGIADDILKLGTKVEKMVIRHSGKERGEMLIGDAGQGQSYYPFILSVTQDEHEEVLERKLAERGTHVEWGVEVANIQLPDDGDDNADVKVSLRPSGSGAEEHFLASYVIGCDGAHSVVRHSTGITMEGGTYANRFFVADVYCHGDMQTQGQLNLCMMNSGFAMVAPLPHKENRARLVSLVPKAFEDNDNPVTFEDCWPSVSKAAPNLVIDKVNWFSCYKVHHRCASSFQAGKRAFLCGDSAHLHSPVGGQGMNTGLGDASNLAWKIATAWHAQARGEKSSCDDLLATYTFERKRFADQLVQSTDQFFQIIISQGISGWLIRNILVPYLMPFFAGSGSTKPSIFTTTSQIGIEYGSSKLSTSIDTKSALAGARLPWIEEADNHQVLDGMGWQMHAFGSVPENVQSILKDREVPVHTDSFSAAAKANGFVENNIYLVRPDGYVGLVLGNVGDVESKLREYIDQWGVGRLDLGT
jgi:2-polyprenyl-6-methoxyphenol hydroxylase-like FAD-dependent oxidoreductase